jgi:hypothetical protein
LLCHRHLHQLRNSKEDYSKNLELRECCRKGKLLTVSSI